MPPPIFKHFSHNHPLVNLKYNVDIYFRDDIKINVSCRMCLCLFVAKQSVYYCHNDFYAIHKTCGDLPQHMNHSLHSHHDLTLIIRNNNPNCPTFDPSTTSCSYCDLPFHKYEPFYYKCDHCPNFFMHPTCAMVPLLTIPEDHEKDRFSCHGKPMSLVAKNHHDEGEKCFACGSIWSGLQGYVCVESTCKNFLHESCVEKLARTTMQHPFHPQHALALKLSKPRSCFSCFRKDCRLVFSCVEGPKCTSNIHLCTKCVFLEKNINCQSHDHSLSLVENFSLANARDIGIRCDACRKDYKKCDEVDMTQTYLFRCMECDFNLHFLCGPLPITLKYEFHIHPLNLVDHLVTKDDSDEYYCDVCEEKRDTQCRLYYCQSCKYNAHIHCLLREIMKAIKGDHRDVELCALGENRWIITSKLENSKQNNEMTLNDLMNSLTPQEKRLLTKPFGNINIPSYNIYKEINSRFEREGNSIIEDINWIQELFQFGDSDLTLLDNELFTSSRIKGSKVDEKYKRQKLIDVNGYLVPKTLAPILNTLLVKHGIDNICKKSSLRREMKSVFATILCSVIDDMSRANIEDITMEDLTHWYSNLFGILEMGSFNKIIYSIDFLQIVRLYPCLKAIRIKKDVSEKLQLGIEELESELKMYKENRKKIEKYEDEASDFMKKGLPKAKEMVGKKVIDLFNV